MASPPNSAPPRPITLDLIAENVPASLTRSDQFMVWDWELRQNKQGVWAWTKPPYRVDGGGKGSSTDPETWGSFRQALGTRQKRGLPGIGFALWKEDPFCFGDVDDCRDPVTGEIASWARPLLARFAKTYQEASPSGTGVKIILRGRLPGTHHRWSLGDDPLAYVEWFDEKKYTTLTGHRLDGTGDDAEDCQDELDALYRECFPPRTAPEPTPIRADVGANGGGGPLSDEDVVRIATNAKNGQKFRALFEDGDAGEYGNDESAADEALMCHLVFYTQDRAQLERIFGRSALGRRDKWKTRANYRKLTIDSAIDFVGGRFTPRPLRASSNGAHPEPQASPEPEPRPEEPWPVMADEAFSGLAGTVVGALSPHSEADDVALLVTFLVLFGGACNRAPYVYAGEDRHGTNLFAALVGSTGKARKGTSMAGPRRVVEIADPQFVADRLQGGLNSGEGLIWHIRDRVTKTRKDGSEEVLVEGIDDKRLVCLEEELSSTLKVAERDGNTLSETVRRAWDARRALASMTKNSPAKATNPHVSIIGHITGDELKRTLTDTAMANGLGNRFLWFVVKRSKVLPHPGRLSEREANDLGQRVGEALADARRSSEYRWDAAAYDLWSDVYGPLSDGKPGLAGAMVARGEAQVLRLSLIYALLDQSRAIGEAHLRSALAVWSYVEASVRRIFGDATGDPIADRILAALRANGPMSQTALRELFGGNVPAARLSHATETLLSLKRVRSRQEATGGRGRPLTIWEAVG